MKMRDLTILPVQYFQNLVNKVRTASPEREVQRFTSYTFRKQSYSDFLAVWPSKENGEWILITGSSNSFTVDSNSHYKKMVFFNSENDLLGYVEVDKTPTVKLLPPL